MSVAPTPLRPRLEAAEVSEPPRLVRATPFTLGDPRTIPRRQWIYGRTLLRGTVSLVIAPGAVGKTAMLAGTALALATGRDLLGHRVWDRPQRVWLWNLEDPREELDRLLHAAALHWQISAADLGDRLFADSALDGAELKLAVEDRDGFRIARPLVDALVDELLERQVDVLVIDPFVSSHGVNENDNSMIDAIAKEWARIAVRANCSITLVHHARKLGSTEANAEAARGAGALVAAARSVLALNKMSEEEAERFGIEGEERRRFFRAFDDKANRAPPADASDWYRLASVALGNGSDGDDEGDSIAVVLPWSPPEAFDGVTVDHLRKVQARVADGLYRKSDQHPDWVGRAVAEVMSLNVAKAADKKRVIRLLREWVANDALREEERMDPKVRKLRPFIVVGVPAEDAAPPPHGWRKTGGAVERSTCATTTSHIREVGGGGASGGSNRGWRGGAQILSAEDEADGGSGGLDGWPE